MAFCLGTLVELLHQILYRDHDTPNPLPLWVLDIATKPQIESLFRKVSFLRDFLANSTPALQARIEHLEDLIRDAAENAEDLLESYIKTQVLSSLTGESILVSPPELDDVIQILDSTTAEMIKIRDTTERSENTPLDVPTRRTDVLVGVGPSLKQLKDRITSETKSVEVISIVGMGGIGKTTLARKLYDEYSADKHFDICLWATVSQVYDQRQVLLSLLNCKKSPKTNAELKLELHQLLCYRRYLIVIDDIWSSTVWDDMRTSLPDDNESSRVILTTRENNVADYVGSQKHEMDLLKKEESWELFHKIVYGVESCPADLEEVAHKIVNSCGGLPLAVKVISGFLSRAKRSRDSWEKVAHDVSSFIGKEDKQFSGIFSWSYANLPHYLKPCLLYISAYPEDYAILASRLIKMWVAEGFLNPTNGKSPEEVAEMCLKALVDRNLIFVRKTTFNKVERSYGIHDLLRDLCMRKAEEKKFIKAEAYNMSKDTLSSRRICVSSQNSRAGFSGFMELMPQVRSIQIVGEEPNFPSHGFELSLLRVLDTCGRIRFAQFPEDILKLIGLRYLDVSCDSLELPDNIIVLRNLQTMIIRFSRKPTSTNYFQMRMFELPQLRHVELIGYSPWNIPSIVPNFGIRETLQSLSDVSLTVLKSLLGKFPNLKELGIERADEEFEYKIDLTCFPKLQTIRIQNFGQTNFILPDSLENLTVSRAYSFSQEYMSRIGGLPKLESLQLEGCKFENSTWEASEDEFCKLQYLKLNFCENLENWIADETPFPQLKHLDIVFCPRLKEIPLEIGEIDTLEIIQVDYCKDSVFDSGRSIIKQKSNVGNVLLQIRLLHQYNTISVHCDKDEDRGEEEGSIDYGEAMIRDVFSILGRVRALSDSISMDFYSHIN